MPSLPASYSATGIAALGRANKSTVNSWAPDSILNGAGHQVVFSDGGTFTSVGELAHVAMVGPEPGNLKGVAEVWHANTTWTPNTPQVGVAGPALDSRSFMLDFSATAPRIDTAKDYWNIPHSWILFDRLTCINPDRDGDGAVTAQEQVIRGLINVNTMPQELLAQALPIPDTNIRNAVADAIHRWRIKDARPAYRSGMGIVSMGELFALLNHYNTILQPAPPPPPGGQVGYQRFGVNTRDDDRKPAAPLGTWIDTLGQDSGQADGVVDDREEEALLFRMLSNVVTIRSDVFCAWVVVRGYNQNRFDENPVEAARFYAIFDRSGITGPNDQVKVTLVRIN